MSLLQGNTAYRIKLNVNQRSLFNFHIFPAEPQTSESCNFSDSFQNEKNIALCKCSKLITPHPNTSKKGERQSFCETNRNHTQKIQRVTEKLMKNEWRDAGVAILIIMVKLCLITTTTVNKSAEWNYSWTSDMDSSIFWMWF